MSPDMQSIIALVGGLSSGEKLELLTFISRDLQQTRALEEGAATFRKAASLDELLERQPVPVLADVRSRRGDFWPETESADDINEFVARQRHADRQRAR